jgi:hypothetical protein
MTKIIEFIKPKGINFSCFEEIAADELSSYLLLLIRFLQQFQLNRQLNRYDDWWEHDGLHFFRGESDFNELQRIVSPNGLIEEFKLGDFDVFIGIAPFDNTWYLRFYLNYEENIGRFDITLPREFIRDFEEKFICKIALDMKQQDSKKYYDSIIC